MHDAGPMRGDLILPATVIMGQFLPAFKDLSAQPDLRFAQCGEGVAVIAGRRHEEQTGAPGAID